MWQLSSKDGRRWVRYDGARVSASADLQAVVDAAGHGQPVEVAANTGMIYEPTSSRDPIAVFLHARAAIGWPQVLTGTAPPGVPVPAPVATGPGTPIA